MSQGIEQSTRFQWLKKLVPLTICLSILLAGMGVSIYLLKTAPRAKRRPPQPTLAQVETMALVPVDHQVTISAMGSVVPAREIVLKARVSGQVVAVHPAFSDGGIVREGERLVTIDDQDYRLALAQKKSQLADARYALKLEQGRQEVAQREWELLNDGTPASAADVELALRKPHLAKAQADLEAARAQVQQARLNLERTMVVAPFNTMIRATHVQVGSQISTQDALADLVETDRYWIRVTVPMERLDWIQIPNGPNETGASATVHYRGQSRTGHVIRLLGDLETQGRMARVLVTVDDPLGMETAGQGLPSLLLGEYVRVDMQGRSLSRVYRIPRTSLRDGNTIWLLGPKSRLQILPVEITWRDEHVVLIENGVQAGQRLVLTDLAAVVQGMPLLDAQAEPAATESLDTETRDDG